MGTRTFEERTLRADYKRKLSAAMRFDFTQLPDQFNDITPVNVTWKAAGQETFQKRLMFVIEMRVHSSSFRVGIAYSALRFPMNSPDRIALQGASTDN
jgi:hypothetical protein